MERTVAHEGLPEESERVIEITWRRIALLLLLATPLLLLSYIGYGIMQAYYGGPTNVIIEAAFDKKVYAPGDSVTVNVAVSSGVLGPLIKLPRGGQPVGIEVRDANGNPIYVGQADTDAAGGATFVFKLAEGAAPGEYVVYLASTGGALSAEIAVGT